MKLPTTAQMRAALRRKQSQRPVSRNRNGILKAGCKWPDHRVRLLRRVNMAAISNLVSPKA